MMKKEMILLSVLLAALLLPPAVGWSETRVYFKFDNIKGSNFTDDTGRGLLGTLGLPPEGGAPEVVAGPSGAATDKAVKLTQDKELIVDDATLMNLEMYPPMTIELWLKSPGFTIPESMVAIVAYGGGSGGYRLQLNQDGTIAFVGTSQVDTGVAFPMDNAWHHVAVVDDWDQNVIILYLDGQEVFRQDGAIDTSPAGTVTALYIGKLYQSPNNVTFEGEMDRIRMSNKALAAGELDSNAATMKAATENTVLLLDFDEGKVPYVVKGLAAPMEAITLQAWSTGNAGGPEIVTDTPSGKAGDFALRFNGEQIARVEDPNGIIDVGGTGNDWTLEAWVKYENTSLGRMIIFYYGPGGISFSLSDGNPRRVFVTTLRIADIDSGSAEVPPGEWHHVAVVHRFGDGMYFYVDGEELGYISNASGARNADVRRMNIGSEPNGVLPYDGWIDRIRVSDVALEPSQFDSVAGTPAPVLDWAIY
ncbi:MAG: LamG domain-containing protein [bacterium]